MDTRIALAGQPVQLDNPLNNLARAYQIKQAQAALADRDQKLAQQNALNEAWRASGGDLNKLRTNLIQGGQGAMVPGIEQSFAKTQEAQGAADTASAGAILKHMDLSRRMLEQVTTPEQFLQWHQANHADPVLQAYLAQRGITADSSAAQIQQALQTPGGFEQLLSQSKLGLEKSMENVYQSQNLGGTQRILNLPKYGGGTATVVPGSEGTVTRSPNTSTAADGMTPYQQAQVALGKERLKVAQDAERRKQLGVVDLPPKTRQAREAAYPKATLALKDFSTKADNLIKDLETLRDSSGLNGMTGLVYGRTPNLQADTRRAQALFDKILARGSFQELTNMRQSSPTGGALGQVSDFENKKLERAFGGLDTTMGTKDFRSAIDQVIAEIRASKEHTQQAYDMDYEYRKPEQKTDESSQPSIEDLVNKYAQ